MEKEKWFKVIYDTVDLNTMTVQVQIQDKEGWKIYKIYETKKGYYINIFCKREYILVPTE